MQLTSPWPSSVFANLEMAVTFEVIANEHVVPSSEVRHSLGSTVR